MSQDGSSQPPSRSPDVNQRLMLRPELKRLSNESLETGLVLYDERRYGDALSAFHRALTLDRGNARVWYNQGLAYSALNQHRQALDSYDRALQLAPDKPYIWLQRGLSLAKLGRYADAIAAYDRTLALDPEDAIAWHSRGAALYAIQRYDEALAAYDHTLTLAPDRTVIWRSRGLAQQVDLFARDVPAPHPAASVLAPQPPAFGHVPQRPSRPAEVSLLGPVKQSGLAKPQWLVQRGDRYIQLTELLYQVTAHADGQRTLEEIARGVSRATSRGITAENVQHLISTRLLPAGLVTTQHGAATPLNRTTVHGVIPSTHSTGTSVKVIGPQVIDPVARVFQVLYHPLVLVPVLALAFVSQGWIIRQQGPGFLQDVGSVIVTNPVQVLLAIAVLCCSTAFHELGHASALRYGGGRARGMGVGVYLLVYPMFYTDVTDNYRLGRWARVRTDLGGFYFNLIFSAGLILLFAFRPDWMFLLAVVAWTDLDILSQCLPIWRFDGYWALVDLTGVPNLLPQIFTEYRRLWMRLRRQQGGNDSALAAVRPWVSVVLCVYGLLFAFTILMALTILPNLGTAIPGAWNGLVEEARTVLQTWQVSGIAGDVLLVGQLLYQALLVIVLFFGLYNLLRMVIGIGRSAAMAAKRSWEARRRRVGMRTGMLATAGIAAQADGR